MSEEKLEKNLKKSFEKKFLHVQPRVLCDFHHAGLLHSLVILFEGRLEGLLFRPIGRQWYDEGYWKVFDHPATVAQYLDVGGATPDDSQPLNTVDEEIQGLYNCRDIDSGEFNKAITLDSFKKVTFDIIIASIPQHVKPFRELRDKYQPQATLLYQIGNAFNITDQDRELVDGFLVSARIDPSAFGDKPHVVYHQEFDIYDTFFPVRPINTIPNPTITSLVNCFSVDGMFKEDWDMFLTMEFDMPQWKFRAYGGQCRDGAKHGALEVSRAIRESRFIWHVKKGGDGYGHIIHNAAASARPLIVKMEYYNGKLAEDFLIDGKTCIAIDGLSRHEIKEKINWYSSPVSYSKMSHSIYGKFMEVVDFDKEELAIRDFLQTLAKK